MVLYGKFLELHELYTSTPILLRADLIIAIEISPNHDSLVDDVVKIWYVGMDNYYLVEEDYETVRGLLGQVYGKKG